jgi:thiamine kinase-like enzyme
MCLHHSRPQPSKRVTSLRVVRIRRSRPGSAIHQHHAPTLHPTERETSRMTELENALARIPFLAGVHPAAATRLAGLTNINYLVDVGAERLVLRIPGAGTGEYIDRVSEEVAARSAAAAGVNAPVLFFDPTDGLMVTRFIDGAITMTADRFRDLDAVARAARAFRRLHTRAEPFATDFQLFAMIDDYKRLITEKGAAVPDGYAAAETTADATRRALEATARPLVPSHCDPLCENLLDTGEQMVVIDYEYSGNNDPMWDLGDLSVEGSFGPAQDAALLTAYFGHQPPAHEVGRMVAYKAMCDLLWTLWGVIQHANGNPAEDFWAYAVGRFERCRALMSTPEYTAQLECISAAPL